MSYLGLDPQKAGMTAQYLNQLLADYHVYYQNLRNFHWNIKGEQFYPLHEKFEGLYSDARLKIDEIAERVLSLRYAPLSNMSVYLEKAAVREAPFHLSDREMVATLLQDHEILIKDMRSILGVASESGDEGTIDMVSGFLGYLEKESWMLDAWFTREKVKKMMEA